jgi:hypothetical protein
VSINAFNDVATERYKGFSYAAVLENLGTNRRDFIAVLDELASSTFEVSFTYPWGESGPIGLMVKIFVDHELEHVEEIEKLF